MKKTTFADARLALSVAMLALAATVARADQFHLLIGVDPQRWPDVGRSVTPQPGPCCATTLFDGDRLAGNSPTGDIVNFEGEGTPLFDPNQFGSTSFMFRRGSVPVVGNQFPLMGVDFLGGPLLDLDGDLNNGSRSLVPVTSQTPVAIPDTFSHIDLTFDTNGAFVTLDDFDVTGTNEGGPGIGPGVATTINTMAGTQPDASQVGTINPLFDTRIGALAPFAGSSGLSGVYSVTSLGFEFWQDTVLASSSTASTLGTFQFLGSFRGWWISRDPVSGQFPALSGEGLGGTLWPMVNTTALGVTIDTANGLAGGTATIITGFPADDFTAPGNGGTGPTDLGGYFDNVIVPLIHPLSESFVYLEAAGFGVNNSGDPIYLDTVAYDVVIIAQQAPRIDGDLDGDGDADLADMAGLQICLAGGVVSPSTRGCDVFDFNIDGNVNDADVDDFTAAVTGPM